MFDIDAEYLKIDNRRKKYLDDYVEKNLTDKEIENYYDINNLKQKLMENDFIKIRDNVFINQDIEFVWPNLDNKIINGVNHSEMGHIALRKHPNDNFEGLPSKFFILVSSVENQG